LVVPISHLLCLVVGELLDEELSAAFLLLLRHVHLVLDVLARGVDLVSKVVGVISQKINWLAAYLAACLFELWQAL
jgi:hypothetical protein